MVVMRQTGVTHVLLDFFGTLVDYEPGSVPSPTGCVELVEGSGITMDAVTFSNEWETVYQDFETAALSDHREFSMDDLAAGFLTPRLRRTPTPDEVRALAATYIREWNVAVTYPATTPSVVNALADRFTLAVVSNTHEPDLVPDHLARMGIADRFATIVTSVGLGWRKPHPTIYAEALERLGIRPEQAVFAGDSYLADFVGPQEAGIHAYLIDPARIHADVPEEQRLRSLDDLPSRL